MAQIKSALSRQYLDPREAAPPPVFREGVMQLSDARVGMELMGTVRNVVDFGWFVDCGLGEDGAIAEQFAEHGRRHGTGPRTGPVHTGSIPPCQPCGSITAVSVK